MLRKPILFLLLTFLIFQIEAQSPDQKNQRRFKAALSYVNGPEVPLRAFPPFKVSLDFFYDQNREFYVGIDGGTNIWGLPWTYAGLQAGYQTVGTYVECGLDFFFYDKGKRTTLNPRIGYDFPIKKGKNHFFVEIGPGFVLKKDRNFRNNGASDRRYSKHATIGTIPLNLEFGINGRF